MLAPTMRSASPRLYPQTDHCDGRIFFNPDAPPLPTLRDLLRWKFGPKPNPWPKQIEFVVQALPIWDGNPRRTAVIWINHASFLIQTGAINILVDPVYSDVCGPFQLLGPRRVHPPGIAFDALPPIHLLLVTHDHYDHCDLQTLRRVAAKNQPLVVVPLGNRDLMLRAGFTRIVELDWWESYDGPDGITLTLTPCQHWSNRLSGRRCGRLWGGFRVCTAAEQNLQVVGDTGYHPRLFKTVETRLGAPDLALVPIGAYEPRWFMRGQHCNPEEAVQIHHDLAAKTSIAMHWGTFQLTNESREDPPNALYSAMSDSGLAEEIFRVLEPGQSVVI